MERVQKIIASSGFCSRRKAEELIKEGKVTVNGEPIEIGRSADSSTDKIQINGASLPKQSKYYFAFYKPVGVETTLSDPKGRKTVADFLPNVNARLYPVGRLDYFSEGLLFLTNDGEFSNKVMHPRYEINKTYIGMVDKPVSHDDVQKLRRGVNLSDGKTWPAKVFLKGKKSTLFEMTIHEGRNRIIRRMFAKLGYKVKQLKRIKIGIVSLGNLKRGAFRELTQSEVRFFMKLVSSAPVRAQQK